MTAVKRGFQCDDVIHEAHIITLQVVHAPVLDGEIPNIPTMLHLEVDMYIYIPIKNTNIYIYI